MKELERRLKEARKAIAEQPKGIRTALARYFRETPSD